MMSFLSLGTFIYVDDFTPAFWLDNLHDSSSWGWIRLNNGHWWVIMPDYRGCMINDMKVNYQQKGSVLYGCNSENKQYDIPAARINEETSTYMVVYWYTIGVRRNLKKYKPL
jgi:hypothetical protein